MESTGRIRATASSAVQTAGTVTTLAPVKPPGTSTGRALGGPSALNQ